MNQAVLDTTVAGFAVRGDTRVEAYRPWFEDAMVVLPFQSAAELWLGARRRKWGPSRLASLERHLGRWVIWGYEAQLGQEWVEVMLSAQAEGRRLEPSDAWIAATATLLQAPLLTHDRDFTRIRHPHLTVVCHAP